MIIRALKPEHGKVRIIPTNMDKYLAIQVGRLLFLDSLQFTLQSLETLASTLHIGDFVHTQDFFDFGSDRTTWDHYFSAPALSWNASEGQLGVEFPRFPIVKQL